jgi:hypothetical protein
MRSQEQVAGVLALVALGLNNCEISRRTGVPRTTVRGWRAGRVPGKAQRRTRMRILDGTACERCGHPQHDFEQLDAAGYSYLLGMYLGDGHITRHRRGVYRLSVYCDAAYPGIVEECAWTMLSYTPSLHVGLEWCDPDKRGRVCRVGAYSKVWPCLFPQHGPGRKHTRKLALVPWQEALVETAPEAFLRGLIHSDGCRSQNRVRGTSRTYTYPRYTFCNRSADIRRIFCDACDKLGIEWRVMNERNISVARQASVARLDEFVGPKF